MATRHFCDQCEAEMKQRGSHNKCSWCGRDLCNTCLYLDDYDRSSCERCAREKAVKVRRVGDPPGSEEYLPTKQSRHPAER